MVPLARLRYDEAPLVFPVARYIFVSSGLLELRDPLVRIGLRGVGSKVVSDAAAGFQILVDIDRILGVGVRGPSTCVTG